MRKTTFTFVCLKAFNERDEEVQEKEDKNNNERIHCHPNLSKFSSINFNYHEFNGTRCASNLICILYIYKYKHIFTSP